jgi:hypothetical protein
MPETLAELALLGAAVWALYRLLSPLRIRVERALLAWLDPSRKPIEDAEIVPKKRRKE